MNPTLVLLPGLHGTDKLFAPFLAELSDRPCLPISLPAVPLTYPQLATHVSSQCASLPSFVIIAESFSGPIAVLCAAAEPRCSGIALCASFIDRPLGSIPALAPALPLGRLLKLRAFSRIRDHFLVGRPINAALSEQISDELARIPSAVLEHRLRTALNTDVRDAFHSLQCPSLQLIANPRPSPTSPSIHNRRPDHRRPAPDPTSQSPCCRARHHRLAQSSVNSSPFAAVGFFSHS